MIVFAFGTDTSGIPADWAARDDRPGVDLLPDLSELTVRRIADRLRQVRRPRDIVVASIHWGGNWGYDVPRAHVCFAHRLVDGGIDVVHGHSSHHPRPIEGVPRSAHPVWVRRLLGAGGSLSLRWKQPSHPSVLSAGEHAPEVAGECRKSGSRKRSIEGS